MDNIMVFLQKSLARHNAAKSLIITLTSSAALGTAAFGADLNTYRAGDAYLKLAAGNPIQCEQQCLGDAQCRGWNFVRPNPQSASGICEFNARAALPISSPISISGAVNSDIDPLMSRAVPAGSRTRKVGSAYAELPTAAPAQTARQKTIVNRQPIPQRAQMQRQASFTQPANRLAGGNEAAPAKTTAPVSNRTPRTYGGDAPAQTPQAMAPQIQATPSQGLSAEQQYYRQQYLQQQQAAAAHQQQQMQADALRRQQAASLAQAQRMQIQNGGMMAPQQRPYQPQAQPQTQTQANYPQRPPQAPQQNYNNAPVPYAPQSYTAPPAAALPAVAPGVRVPTPQRDARMQQSTLYGQLHDDLTKNMTTVPRPQTAPDDLSNPDAPVSTSRAIPSKPVERSRLGRSAMPPLAGG